MRIRTTIVVAALLVLPGWAAVAQQSKPAAVPPRELTNSVGMKFVRIDPGSFKTGSDSGDADEKPVHEVTLSKGFYLQATEVTQAQWEAVMGEQPQCLQGAGAASGVCVVGRCTGIPEEAECEGEGHWLPVAE